MANNGNIFENGENLQAAIGKALQESKALLCFVSDESDETKRWEAALLNQGIRHRLQSSTVLLRLQAGSQQADFLNSVCPISGKPAIVIIHNAQVVVNYQNGQTTFETLQEELHSRYGQPEDGDHPTAESTTSSRAHIELPPSEGRMRLPDNAYDRFRKLTAQYTSAGIKGKALLSAQLRLLEVLKIDVVTAAVADIKQQLESISEPSLPDEVLERLLNTPASRLQFNSTPVDRPPLSSQDTPSSSTLQTGADDTLSQPVQSTNSAASAPSASQPSETNPLANSSGQSSSESGSSDSRNSQRAQYVADQKLREDAERVERIRIKVQKNAENNTRRRAEMAAANEQRRADLLNLRKANSTTSDPKATDIRLQVRLFDGSTVRNSFPAEATVAKDVRKWIDAEVARKAVDGGATSGQPYNLKLILTPLPNRSIEAGEEDSALCDLDGVKGSATMVMVPVRGYVDSYSTSSSGIVGGVVGGATSMVGAGIGLVGTAAGMVIGGLGRLLGAGAGAGAGQQTQPEPQTQERDTRQDRETGESSATRSNVRVRTLADQRMDEETERRKKGTQLYNGMGLNVQPRDGDDDDKARR